ncbi:site-2 protease family protein [Vulgatibacter sp.]|uniref:site-2 protease family protein n=1 Tax=Vulgatibacter sp. TaxID=1971226 RepID=UPI003563D4C7
MSEPSALDRLRALQAREAAQAAGPVPTRPRAGGWLGGIALAALLGLQLVGKLKFLALFAKLGKFATTAWTMVLMVWAYSLFYGWPFAAGLVLLVLVHELGHGAAAWRVGLRVGAPVFIPFVGAFIALKERPRSTLEDAVIGAGGPLFGTAGALGCIGLSALLPDAGLLLAIGYFGLILNLFNLLPVWGLDGDRMLAPVSARAGIAGVGFLGAAAIAMALHTGHLNPIGLIVVLVAGWQVGRRILRARQALPASALDRMERLLAAARRVPDDGVTPGQRAAAAAVYFGLATGLVILTAHLHDALPDVAF